MSEVGAISVKITGDNTGFNRAMDDTESRLKRGGRELRNSINEWGKWGAAATAAAAGVAAALVKHNLNSIRELRNLSNAANTTVSEFQRGAFAAQQFGIEQEKYGDILKDVNDRVGDFLTTGAGPIVDFFEKVAPKVGVTADAFRDLSGQDALQLYVSTLEKANINQQEMTFFMEAIASESTRLLPLLRDNGRAMQQQSRAAKELGIGLSQIQVDKAIEAQRALDRVSTVFEGELQNAVADLAPAITLIADKMVAARRGGEGFDVALNAVLPAAKILTKGVSAIAIGAKTIQLGFHGAAAAISIVAVEAGKLGRTIFNKLVAPMRGLIDAVDQLPGMGKFDPLIQQLDKLNDNFDVGIKKAEEFTTAQIQAVELIKAELVDLATGDFSFEGIDNLFNQLRQRIIKGREELQKSRQGGGGEQTGEEVMTGQAMTTGVQPFNKEKFEEETMTILEMLSFRYQSQEQVYLSHLEREREMLRKDLEARRITQKQFDSEMVRLTEERERLKNRIVESNIQDGLKVIASGSKKMNKIFQAAALVNAVIKGKEAAVAAWTYGMNSGGPLLAAAYSIASLAKTGSLISSIKSGGKSQGGGGGGGGFSTPSAAPTIGGGGSNQQSPEPDRVLNVMVTGQGLMSTDQVRGLLGQINEELGNGFQLNVQGG